MKISKSKCFAIVSLLLLVGCSNIKECESVHTGDGVYPYDICDLDMENRSESICFVRRCK